MRYYSQVLLSEMLHNFGMNQKTDEVALEKLYRRGNNNKLNRAKKYY